MNEPPTWLPDTHDPDVLHSLRRIEWDGAVTHCGQRVPYTPVRTPERGTGCHRCYERREKP